MQNSQNPLESSILHMDVKDLLKWDSNIDVVTNSITKIANVCKVYKFKNIFNSSFI